MPPRGRAAERRQLLGRCTPGATEHDYQPKTGRDEQHAGEEQSFDAMLNRVKKDEGEDQREEEQQQRPKKRMPEPCLERLAQPNHGGMVLEAPASSLMKVCVATRSSP